MLVLAGCQAADRSSADAGPPVDFAGTWLPDAQRAEPWPDELPLQPAARAFLESFNPAEHDATTFCMPFGTPRNMLQTGYPLEIAQTPDRLVMVIQPNLANAEVRRIALDGSAMPEAPEASWYGTSRGYWEGNTLVVETIGLREDAIVSESGLAHSGGLRVIERLQVVEDAGHGKVLIDDIELHDPEAYEEPLKTRRYFAWAPHARPRDSSCVEALWTEKLWRDRLQEHAGAARAQGASR
jgi:hypothetical protein